MGAGYYLLTLVFHDQAEGIASFISAYEARLAFEGLPDTPFHDVDLIHGHERYESHSVETRKRLLIAFSMFVRTLPIKYKTFKYSASDVMDEEALRSRVRRDIVSFILEYLDWLQEYDSVPIYYDGGRDPLDVCVVLRKRQEIQAELPEQARRKLIGSSRAFSAFLRVEPSTVRLVETSSPESGFLWLSVTSHLSVPRRLFGPLLV